MVLRRYFGKISPLQIGNLVGHEGEFVIDESTNYVYVMDGVTPGGQRILYTNVNAAVSNIYANVNPSVNNYFTLGNVSNVWANAFISNINSYNIALTNNFTIGNIQMFYQSNNNKLAINGDTNIYGNLNVSGSEIAANSTVTSYSKSTNFINTAAPGYNNGFSFSNGTYGDSGIFHTLSNSNVIQVYLAANGKPFVSASGDGNGSVGFTNTIVNGNLTISGFSPYTTQIGFAPTFVPSNSKLTYADQQNTYIQFLLQNKSSGNSASTDIVLTSDNGTDTTHYIDLGINSSTFNGGGGLDGPDDGYLLVEGGKLLIATIDQPNDIVFAVGGDAPSNEIGRFKYGNGFSVNGNLTVTGNLNVTGNIVTTNYETISNTEYANSIIASGNITANGNVGAVFYTGNGYYLTGLQTSYSNTNVAAYLANSITTDINITGNISPTANAVYSLGTQTNQWKSLYVSNNTIYIGGTPIQVANGSLIVGGNTVSGVGSTYSNSNVAAYLPTNSVIIGINANIVAANSTISALTSNAASQASDIIVLYANAGTQANLITTINANILSTNSAISTINANIIAANSTISALTSNAASQASDIIVLYANAGTQANSLSTLNSTVVNLAGTVATIQAGSGFATTQQLQAANSSITTLNANLNAANLNITNLQSNTATIASNVNIIFTNVVTLATNINTLFTNAASQASDITVLYSNAASQATTLNTLISNASTQESEIAFLNANVTAANSAIVTANSAVTTYATNLNATMTANIVSTNSRVTVLEGNVVSINNTLVGVINGAFSYGNANVASYLPTYSGALTAGNITASGNVGATFFTGNGYYLTGLPATYGNTQVAAYLPTYSGNSNAAFFTGNGYYLTGIISGSTYSNSNVSAYYVANTVATGNIQILSSGNIRLPTGGVINESQGTGTITLVPNTTASATAGVVIGGSGYLLAANGSRNAVLNYNSVNGQFGVAVLNIYNSAATAIVNGGTSNIGNIGGPSSYFGNAFVSNIYSQNYFYPNGTSILSGIGGTYSNSNVASYLPTYSGNSNATFFTGNGYYLTGITSGSTYSNSNVGYYLNSNVITSNITIQGNINTNGNLVAGNIITNGAYYVANITTTGGTSGNISGSGYVVANNLVANSNIYANGFYWLNNGAAFSSGAGSTYSNSNVAGYLPTYAGNVNANFYLGNGYYLTGITGGGSTYSNTNVAAYLVTYNGNISAGNLSLSSGASGNISGTGYVVAGNMVANTGVYGNSYYWYNNNATLASTITGTYANANVAGYMPTYTGNVNAGNIILTNLGNIIAATNSNLSIRTYGLYNILTIYGVAGGYNSPPYTNQSLTGGNGSGMTATYSSVGGYVSTITVTNPGTGYKNGDILTLPGGLGSTVILSNYNQNITTSKAYNWTFSTYDGNVTVPGNIIMPSNSYVLGDFTNSNVAYRTFFQTTTANATTGIYAVPSGTGTGASWQALNTNATNANNASKILIATNGNTDVQLISGVNGSGTYLPLSFYNNNAAQMVIYPNGNVYMSNANPITTTGNVNAGYFVGNGSALTGIQANLQAGNIYGTSSNVTIVAGTYSSVFSNVGMVTMPNVTVTGNTSVTGNITAGNVIATGTSGMQTRFLWDTWQANTNASLTSFTPSGSISGNASWDANQAYGLKLTPATNTQNGNIYWNSSTVNYNYDMVITASVGASGGNGADGQYIFLGCSAVPTSQSNNVGGIHVYNHYYSNQWEIYVAGTQYIIPFISEDATNYLPSGIRVWNATYPCFYNITVKIRRIQNGARMLEIYLNEAYQGSVNISSWNPAGNYFGVTGTTGGSNSQHWVRQLRIDW